MNEQRLLDSIRRHEGYREHPYRDSLGFWTIGYGHLLENIVIRDSTVGVLLDRITDRDVHEEWLLEDVQTAIEDARRWMGATYTQLSDQRQEVLAEMAFQLGYSGLCKFVKFKAGIFAEDWNTAAHEMTQSVWADQTPGRVLELHDKFRLG